MTGWIYFVQRDSDGPIKIGYTAKPLARIAALQTGSAEKLTFLALVPGDESDEQRLHLAAADHRLGGEWFVDCADVRALIPGIPSPEPRGDEWISLARIISQLRDDLFLAETALVRREGERAARLIETAADSFHDTLTALSSGVAA